MLDLKWIRENPEYLRQGLQAKGVEVNLEDLLKDDTERRALIRESEALKANRNEANQEITRLKKAGKTADSIIEDMKSTSQKIKDIDAKVGELDNKIDEFMLSIPNLPHETVPVGKGNSANKVVRSWQEPRKFLFKPKNHLKLTTHRGPYLSMEWGAKITGSGFPVFMGLGARLERALINFMLDFHLEHHGYEEIWPPSLVNRDSMIGTGQLPKLEQDMYQIEEDKLFLIPTGEVPVTNLWRDQNLKEEELPKKYVAYTPCFRREAGSYGKDTQGLSRVHQFDKVEMVKLVHPDQSLEELEALVKNAEAILQALELPYRVVLLGSGDMSFAAAKCYDLEVWAPGSEKWFEISSCSTFGDFQARRMNIRYRKKENGKLEPVHTLNGSGVALARTLLCLVENFQTPDGKIDFENFPTALKSYLPSV